MALPSVKQMVLNRLPYLVSPAADTIIEQTRLEAVYLLQSESVNITPLVTLEDETTYPGLWNMMFADMVKYWLVQRKAVETMAGNGTSAGTAAKTLKRAKADVTEAEFVVIKASDGALIQISTDEFLRITLKDICDKALTLQIANPLCFTARMYNVIPAFIRGNEYPDISTKRIDALLDGTPIGN